MNSPAISVVMSVYNGEEHLAEALDSILSQTFIDFEFIIVDDASTDATPTILAHYAQRDPRIRIFTNEINSKIAVSLNRGLVEARAPLIARMDADDWSHPERFAKQYAFMQEHPEVTVCGTWLETYEAGDAWQWACDDASIRAQMLFNSVIAHPTAMFRKDAVLRLTGGYDARMPPAEDYALWARLMEHEEVRFANIPSVLFRYRRYPEKDRAEYCDLQHFVAQEIRLGLLRHMGLDPSEADLQSHLALALLVPLQSMRALREGKAWGTTLLSANECANAYDAQIFRHEVERRWQRLWQLTMRTRLSTLWVTYVPECVRARYRALKKCIFLRT